MAGARIGVDPRLRLTPAVRSGPLAKPDDNVTEVLPAPAEHLPPDASLIGRTLGKFAIVERLGRGGSGEVFRAEQVQLGRSAVIKVLRRDVAAAPNRVDRFLREAKLASRLDHPYAAHIYAFGVEPDGLLWIAMEYVRGATLDELVTRRGPMPPALFGPLFARLCEVVHTAHELGIVHRDIKGSNVMVIERAGQLLPKLLDFGIAKGLDGGESPGVAGEEALTGHGSTLGSPHYMAPEQWESPHDVDARADIYALGVLAYRCVSGRLPFHGVERAGLSAAHLAMPPPALPASVSEGIADVIGRALAKQPAARWSSALAFGEAMRRAVGGRAPEALPALDAGTRDAWFRGGPQPLADAMARLARATTTVEADAALRELVAITCRWVAVLALSQLAADEAPPEIREQARGVAGRDDAGPWLRLARVAARVASSQRIAGLANALAEATALEALADRLDDRDRARTAEGLAFDIAALGDALRPLEVLLAYQLVVGRGCSAESWQGARRRDRERVIVWGDLADGTVALLDGTGRIVSMLSPLVQVCAPTPSSEPELFLLWRTARGHTRLVAAPWGFERDDEAAARHLALLITEASDAEHDDTDHRSPYPGLAPYGVADASRFVGREREVEALANRLVRSPLIAVLGPSGAGKSSFIHAGVLPRLAEQYEIITLRPGRHPLHALAATVGLTTEPSKVTLDHPSSETEETVEARAESSTERPIAHARREQLERPAEPTSPPRNSQRGLAFTSDDTLVAKLRSLGERSPRGLVIAIDQLEELVTLCSDADERSRFARVLAEAADSPAAPVRVVVTLRDDFATVIESEDAIRGRFDVFVLATPAPEALRRIVIEPARRAHVTVDPRVVDDMVAEVAGRPASLPLLSFTASQLWTKRQARRITHDAYLVLGGVAGALSTYAESVYASLARRDQNVVRDLFARLVASDGTRIPAPRAELEQLPGARGVLAHLIDARLLVVRDDEAIDIVEIVHECLAERWPRLARWRSEDAADRALLGDLKIAARRWHESQRDPDLLWRGEALAELRLLAARSTALTELERAFHDAAVHAQQRSRRRRRIVVASVMIALVALTMMMTMLGLAANRSRGDAERSATAARDAAKLAEERLTTSLIAQGRRELNDKRALPALAYFAEALRRGSDSSALRLMIAVASRAWRFELPVDPQLHVIELEDDTEWIVGSDAKGQLHWWSAAGAPLGVTDPGLGTLDQLRTQPDGRLLVSARTTLALLDPKTRKLTHKLTTTIPPMIAHVGPAADEVTTYDDEGLKVYSLTGELRRKLALPPLQALSEPRFAPSGSHLVLAARSTIDVIDLVTMTRRTIATDADGPLTGSDDDKVLGYIDRDGLAHLIRTDGSKLRTFRPANRAHTLVFSPTGDRIGGLSDEGFMVHDAAGKLDFGVPAIKSAAALIEIRGETLWIAGTDGVVQRYERGLLVTSLPGQLGELSDMRVTSGAVVTLGQGGRLAIVRGDALHFRDRIGGCKDADVQTIGIASAYRCGAMWDVYVGRDKVASVEDRELGYIAHHAASRRTAIAGEEIVVYEDTKPIARTKLRPRATVAFEDRDRLIVASSEQAPGVWRWTPSADRWEVLATVPKAGQVEIAAGGILVATHDDALVFLHGSTQTRTPIATRASFLTASSDRRWLAAQLANGATLIVDGHTGAIVRELEQSDTFGMAAVFDHHGDLVMRAGRGGLTIWDRATGDAVIWGLDLLQHAYNGRFLPDGRIELAHWELGVIDLPIDRRPAAAILADIACKVPLRVVDGRLGPAKPECPHAP